MNIFFDLDGTLLDISQKYYAAYVESLKKIDLSPLPLNQYWKGKRNKISEDKILKIDRRTKKFLLYEKTRIKLLERKRFLMLDKPFPWVYKLLGQLGLRSKLYIITLRRNRKNLVDQLKLFKLDKYFLAILSSKPSNNPILTKARLIKKVKFNNDDIVIGDTEIDVQVARSLCLKSIAVSSGIRTKIYLKQFKPDLLVKDASKIVPLDVL